MINRLLKTQLMYDKRLCRNKIPTSIPFIKYEFQISKTMDDDRDNIEYICVDNHNLPTTVPFFYEDIKFNMIPCPTWNGRLFKILEPKDDMTGIDRSLVDVSIDQPFFLGETEISIKLFESIYGERIIRIDNENKDSPMTRMTFFECIFVCNELSKHYGLQPYYTLSNIEYDEGCISKAEVKIIDKKSKGFRLPTVDEWLYAASIGGTLSDYSGSYNSDQLNSVACFSWQDTKKGSFPAPLDVAMKRPNQWGFYDMTGNVEEWCFVSNVTYPPEKGGSIWQATMGGSYKDKIDKYPDNLNLILGYYKKVDPASFGAYIGFRLAKNI
jgi:formylglycine-generating enzyme required for sulfatase activity